MLSHPALPPFPEGAPDLVEDFSGPRLRSEVWVDHYLPHWTTPERSAARYDLDGDGLLLRIDEDQLDWRPEDGALRVSNLQTAMFSGPLGSSIGTHRHRPDGLVVRTPAATRLLWTPSAGRIDVTIEPSRAPGCMLAVWLVGVEHLSPHDCGEICLLEIDGDSVGPDRTIARYGIKAHGDDRLTTQMREIALDTAPRQPLTWTALWGEGRTTIGVQGRVLETFDQAPDYPLMLLIDLFEIGAPQASNEPKTARIGSVTGWDLGPRTSTS